MNCWRDYLSSVIDRNMNRRARITSGIWLILLIGALGFLVWRDRAPFVRANTVANLPGRAAPDVAAAACSATGYANDQRELILPDRNEDSFHWIAQTQQMFAQNEWRVRHVDYENAPLGREVNSASPYRWWLGLVAWLDHLISGRSIGLSVEYAALLADPLLHGLLLIGGALLVAWRFGLRSAALLALGCVAIFPFATEFFPGLPDSHGLALCFVLASVLTLVAGLRDLPGDLSVRCWFFVAGVLGGGVLWISVSTGVPLLIGIGLGAVLAAVLARRNETNASVALPPWRMWALGGGTSVLVAYGVEYFPDHAGSWRLDSIHPLYGLAWFGLGEIMAMAVGGIQRREWPSRLRDAIALVLALAAVALVPVVMLTTDSAGFLVRDLNCQRLTHLPEGMAAASLGAWFIHDGFNATVLATLAPLLLIGSAWWLILVNKQDVRGRTSLGLILGPIVVAAGFAWFQLSWWSVVDALLLVLLVVVGISCGAESSRSRGWIWLLPAALGMIAGLGQLWPHGDRADAPVLTGAEAELLIERDVSHWLARHSHYERSVVYAPPNISSTLAFHGGLRVIGTYCPDNDAAVEATLRIAGAGSVQEARLLLQGRAIRYLVLPSWDSFFEDYARLFQNKNNARWNEFLISALHDWRLPPWLRPLPYETPLIGGMEHPSVQIFEVVGDQSPAVAAGRLAECLIAIGEKERAARSVGALRQFPADVGALAAEAQVMAALGEMKGFNQAVESLLLRLKGGADRYLPWDRRVSVAIVLARAKHPELARVQVQQCVAGFDELKAGSLSTDSLYNLLGLARTYNLPFANPQARTWSLQLLSPELRARVE